jgi:hypothetical protein
MYTEPSTGGVAEYSDHTPIIATFEADSPGSEG